MDAAMKALPRPELAITNDLKPRKSQLQLYENKLVQ
jgi:hypothetical protein